MASVQVGEEKERAVSAAAADDERHASCAAATANKKDFEGRRLAGCSHVSLPFSRGLHCEVLLS